MPSNLSNCLALLVLFGVSLDNPVGRGSGLNASEKAEIPRETLDNPVDRSKHSPKVASEPGLLGRLDRDFCFFTENWLDGVPAHSV